MTDVRQAAATPHTHAEVQAAWDVLDVLYHTDATVPHVAGARAAAEWTTGLTAFTPISGETARPVGDTLRWEGHKAGMVAMGRHPGDKAYAMGVMAWMFWWTGLEPLPAWIRVHL